MDLLVFGNCGQTDCFADVALTCPTAPSSASSPMPRGDNGGQEKFCEYEWAAHSQPGSAGLGPSFVLTFK